MFWKGNFLIFPKYVNFEMNLSLFFSFYFLLNLVFNQQMFVIIEYCDCSYQIILLEMLKPDIISCLYCFYGHKRLEWNKKFL